MEELGGARRKGAAWLLLVLLSIAVGESQHKRFARRSQEEPRGDSRSQEEAGGDRRRQEYRGARRSVEERGYPTPSGRVFG